MNRLARLLIATLLTAGLVTLDGPSAGAATSTDGYKPCNPGQGIDLLLMMDESGSLKKADPGGVQRTLALKMIRDQLKGEPDIRIALIGFDTEAKPHMPNFEQASNQHPSDQIIRESLGQSGDTNYRVAVEAALDAFEKISSGANESRCRVLVFFTDGIYDPIEGRNVAGSFGSEEDFANALVDQTCSPSFENNPGFKTQLNNMGIQTYAVLLGDSFQTGIQSADDHERLMAKVSMQVIRAITGHGSSPLVADVAHDPLCRPWSDTPDDQTGEIITVANIDDFANKLLQVIDTSTGLYRWPDCNKGQDGTQVNSALLPAGVYLDQIKIYPFGGAIVSYTVFDSAGTSTISRPSSEAQSRLVLNHEDLEDLDAGWTLQLEIAPSPGETVELDCFGKYVETPLKFEGKIVDHAGKRVDKLLDTEDYRLHVDLGDYVCPIDAGSFTLNAVSPPGSPTLSNRACSPGEQIVEFDYQPSQVLDESESIENFDGDLQPKFAENMFQEADKWLPVQVSVSFEVLKASKNAPRLDCDGPSTITDVSGGFPGHVVARDGCTVIPPLEGTATVHVDWSSATAPDLGWLPKPGALPTLRPGDDPFVFDLESEQLPEDGQPIIDGTVTVTVSWEPPDGSTQPTIGESIRVDIERLDVAHPGSGTFLTCSENQVTIVNTDVKVPRQPIEGSAGCVLEPPLWGTVTVRASWMAPPGVPGPIDWQFDEDQITSGRLGSNNQELTLEAGEAAVRLDFVTTDELDNRRWDLTGDIHLVATWDPLIEDNLPAGDITLPVTLDFQAPDRLICSENQLTITNADIEVPRDTPVKGTAGCVLEPPRRGSLTVVATWEAPRGVPGPIDWQFDEDQVTSGRLGSNNQELTLEPGDQRVELEFVTTDELDNKRWDLTGEIHLVATWHPDGGGDPAATPVTLSVPLDLKGRANSILAFWLAILFVIIAILITYGGLYAILVYANRLPSPEKFFFSTWETTLVRSPNGRLQVTRGERYQPTVDDLRLVEGDRKRNRWLTAGELKIEASHAPFWNMGGLLAGGWGQLNHAGRITQAKPAGRHPGTTRVLFDRLVVVAIEPGLDPDHPAAAVHFLVPRLGPSSGVDGIEALTGDATTVINDLTDRYDQQIKERPDGAAPPGLVEPDPDKQPPPPPPGPSGPSSDGPPPPPPSQSGNDKPPSGGPPPPGPSGPPSGGPPPPGPSGPSSDGPPPPPPSRSGNDKPPSGGPPPPGPSGPASDGPPPPPPSRPPTNRG